MNESVPGQSSFDDLTAFIASGPSGDFVFREGDAGSEMFIIMEGQVELLKTYAGETRQIATLDAGDFFGELSVFENLPRDVTARTLSEYTLLKLDHAAFRQIVHEAPGIALRMLSKLAANLREYREHDVRAADIAFRPLVAQSEEVPAEPTSRTPGPAVLVHTASGAEFPLLPSGETSVGRQDSVAGLIPEVDLTAEDAGRSMSRSHAKIVARDDGYYLGEEPGAHNGTCVNGKLLRGPDRLVQLHDGDHIRFGNVSMIFRNVERPD